jgi:hypothetical protein
MRPPISAEAKGRLRQMWADLSAEAALVQQAVQNVPPAMSAAAVRKGVGSTSAMMRVKTHIPLPMLTHARQRCVWRFLQPNPEKPRSIMTKAVLLGAAGRQPLVIEDFGLLVAHHAIARLYDETAGRADLVAAVLEAHDYLCTLPPIEGERVFSLRNIVLPAGPGAFLVEPRARDENGAPLAVAKTWISSDQLHAAQARDIVAWREFVARLT